MDESYVLTEERGSIVNRSGLQVVEYLQGPVSLRASKCTLDSARDARNESTVGLLLQADRYPSTPDTPTTQAPGEEAPTRRTATHSFSYMAPTHAPA